MLIYIASSFTRLTWRTSSDTCSAGAQALSEGEPLADVWFNRTAEYNARRKGVSFHPQDFAVLYELELTPLPCVAEIPRRAVQTYVAAMVAGIEAETRQRQRREGTRPLGIRAILKLYEVSDACLVIESPKAEAAHTRECPGREVA